MDPNKECVNYPHKGFDHYSDCDEKYVYEQINKDFDGLMPFWATNNISEVTEEM